MKVNDEFVGYPIEIVYCNRKKIFFFENVKFGEIIKDYH